ncbi:MAG TPA: tetratricopeptide repeat protein [Bryobacteraceae bacterium]|nr:tetratricopeptide repeat protein [Bryobacteraceae bacterium]
MFLPRHLLACGLSLAATAAAQLVSKSSSTAAPVDVPATSSVASPKPQSLTPEMRGDIFMARKMYREAAEMYGQAGAQTSPVLANKLGIAHHQMLQFDIARKHYQRAIKLNPKYAEAINNLGTIYYAQKSYRRAIGQYKRALKLTPESASIYSNLGYAQFARKQYGLAMESFNKALELDPQVFERRSTQGVLLQERSVEERAKFYYYVAKAYAKRGVNDLALLYVRKAIEEGFKERDKFKEEPEFAALRELPEWEQLMTMESRVL